MSRPDLSIIIVNWNTRELTANCLRSIMETASGLAVEIIVVDNASSDGSQRMMREQFPHVRLIENTENVGFAHANNEAIEVARGRHVLLLNSDTVVLPYALEMMVRFADVYPKAGVVGCKLLNHDGSLQESWASFPTLWSEMLGRNFRSRQPVPNKPLEPLEYDAYEVDWVGGACLLARLAAINEAGLLDETIFMYSEETDWCYRIKQRGWKVYYLSNAAIVHLGGGSASRSNLMQLKHLYDSKIYFFRKHYGAAQAVLLRIGLVLANLIGLVRRVVLLRLKRHTAEGKSRLKTQWELIGYLLHL